MAGENLPSKDAEYAPWLINFASVATANATLLNLTSGQTTTLTSFANAFQAAQVDSLAKKAASKGATAIKKGLRATTEDLYRPTAKLIAANPNIPADLKAELGLSVEPVVAGPVAPAANLVAEGLSTGENVLRWKRNGNTSTTIFRIEARFGTSMTWTFVANSSRVRFIHEGQTPGVQVRYRIISQRGMLQGSPSNDAVVYDNGETEVFTLKQAA